MNSHSVPPRKDIAQPPFVHQDDARETSGRSIDSRILFRGANEIVIDHEGAKYRLRITRQGKLILNK